MTPRQALETAIDADHADEVLKHRQRLRKPLTRGAAMRFFREVVLSYEGDECLTWPFTRNTAGYAMLWIPGDNNRSVSRLVLSGNGIERPSDKHEAAHSCGNGQKGCVSKKHLSWKTQKENGEDKLIHRQHAFAERHAMAKLTESDVREIRSLYLKERTSALASRYGVNVTCIGKIGRLETWRSVE